MSLLAGYDFTFHFFSVQDLKNMEAQKKTIEKEHMTSLEKLKDREKEIRQLHKVMGWHS